jgi:hypothetical protein
VLSGGRGRRFFTTSAEQVSSACGKRIKKDVAFGVQNNICLVGTYRINSDIKDTSVSAIALVFSFFQYARPLLFWALHMMIGQLLKKTKKTALSPKTEVSLISELIRYRP